MQKIGFLGCGKIGLELYEYVRKKEDVQVVFIQDPFLKSGTEACTVIPEASKKWYSQADIIIECANAGVLKQNMEQILSYCDLMTFSVTAFADSEFYENALELCKKYNRHIYFPHGAILGLDGICDAKSILHHVTVETVKNPKSLGREDTERIIIYEGPTRGACEQYPRNVNVHAAVALAGIGFDATQSRIISDPLVNTNSHVIAVEGDAVSFHICVSSLAEGSITGAYTPLSACGSLDRIIHNKACFQFI